ncbi:MAG: alpha/beta fold hydrolase [Pyrinomonadaceae bacterium]
MSDLKTNGALAVSPWISCPKPNPNADLRLFCFPYAGGSAVIYQRWPEILPATIELCAVQLPGRGTRHAEQPFTRVEPLVEAAAENLLPFMDRPFALFGHSVGAIIGFELARYLRREHGLEPLRLLVSGRRAPQVPDTEPPTYDLPEAEFMEKLRQLNGTPKEVMEHAELMQMMIPLLRADFAVSETYAYYEESPLSCPISAYGGLQDFEVPRENLEAWREQTNAAFLLRMLPGDHFFLNRSQPQLVWALARELAGDIA